MGRNLTRWLIPLPAILFAVFPQIAHAEPTAGLNAIGYTITAIPPTKSDTAYQTCGSETENNINRNFNGEPFQQCPVDYFMIHYTGFITIPANNTIQFMVAADDGGTVKIGTTEFGTWNDKGCSWSAITSDPFPAETYALDGWFYENGGGTCYMLAWNINNSGWAIVPDSAFTTNGAPTTTTTTSPVTTTSTTTTTTSTTTTTTLPETTTTTSTTTSSTTTLPPTTTTTTTTTVAPTTTSTTTTSTSTTTTTQVPYTPPQTSTTSTTTTVPEPATTTTTSVPETSTTLEETSTTVPVVTVPDSTQPATTVPVETTPPTTPPTTQPPQEPDTTQTTQESEQGSSTTTIPDADPTVETAEEVAAFVKTLDIKEDEPISDAKVEQILEVLADATPAQVVAAIEQILATNITSDQAVSIASTPEVLAAVTQEQAVAIFEEIVVEELTVEQADELVAVLNEAPEKVKKAFQETIDVFAGVFDSFQMVGQTIPVGQRRTLVAVSNTLMAVGTSLRRRDKQ